MLVLAGLLACVLAAATAGCSSLLLPHRQHAQAGAGRTQASSPEPVAVTTPPVSVAATMPSSPATGTPRPTAPARTKSSTPTPAVTPPAAAGKTIEHWGAFFGGAPGNYDTRKRPVVVKLPGHIAEIGSSNSTQYALLTDGALYAWGLGSQGQLGDGGTANSFSTPVRVQFPAGVKIASIPGDAMPYDTGLAIDTRGRVWGWGRDGFGDLCLGRRAGPYLRPVQVPLPSVSTVAGASNHVLYDSAGTVYACGQDLDGDLGDGQMRADSARPVRVADLYGGSVAKLVASFADSGALMADGQYFDWGYNGDGQLGDGQPHHASDIPVPVELQAPVTQVAQGGSLWGNGQTLVLLADGSLWSWGDNSAHQLAAGRHAIAPLPVRFYAPRGVTYARLATGTATSYAISTTGQVFAWGTSFAGQVGNGHTDEEVLPELVAVAATEISATANDVVILREPYGRVCWIRPRGGRSC